MTPSRMPSSSRDRLIGRVFGGQYRVDAKIGEGGMGAVYRATQLAVSREVALKVLRANVCESEKAQLVERFRREAHATSRLRHPNTVSVHDFGETEDGILYMVLELLHGAPLSSVIHADGPMPPERVANIGRQIAKSLAEAHACGIIHRDLKPDNVFICDYHGDPDFTKVMDFGIARVVTGPITKDVTRTGMMIGTPKYIAPEQAMARKVSPAADLYSLGVILYEMLSGQPPFVGDSPMAMALAHINEAPPPLVIRDLPPSLAGAWRGLVEALLTKDARRRPQDAGEVARWLGQLERDARRLREDQATGSRPAIITSPGREPPSTYEGPSPRATVTVARRASGSGGVWIALAAVVFMALGGAFSYLLIRSEGSPGSRADVVQDAPSAPHVAGAADPGTAPGVAPLEGEPAVEEAAPAPTVIDLGLLEVEPTIAEEPPAPARLALTSTPAGAAVHLEGEERCATPCELELEPSDAALTLELRQRGYLPHRVDVHPTSGAALSEHVALRRAPPRPRPPRAQGGDEGGGLPALRLDPP